MKFYRSNKGLVQSLTALSICTGLIVSLCVPAHGSRTRLQVEQKTSSQIQADRISSPNATATSVGVIIQWRSTLDADNLGFNVYRLKDGTPVRINREIIPGGVFLINERTGTQDSHSYSWLDRGGDADATYYIEVVSTREVSQLISHPITVSAKSGAGANQALRTQSGSSAEPVAGSTDTSLSQKSFPAAEAAVSPVPNGPLENQWAIAAKPGLKILIKKDGWYRVTQPDMSGAGFNPTVDIRNLRLFADGREVAINTSQAIGAFGAGDYIEFYGRGIDVPTSDTRTYYLIADTTPGKRVRGEIQLDAGTSLPPSLLPVTTLPVTPKPLWFGFVWSFLNLPEATPTEHGQKSAREPDRTGETEPASEPAPTSDAPASAATPVQIRLLTPTASDHTGVASSNEQSQSRETLFRPLVAKKETAQKKAKQKKKSSRKYNHAEIVNAIAPPNFDNTVEQRDRFVYFANLLNGDAENFFGRVLVSSAIDQTLSIDNPDLSAAGPAKLEIALQGVTPQKAHQVNIQLNGTALGSLNYFDLDHSVQIFDVPISLLQNGANTVTFTPVAGGGVSLIDYARITYPHAYRADANKLKFNLRGTQSLKVDGFSTSSVRLIDYTDPLTVSISKPATETTASGYAITVPTSSPHSKNQRLLYAFPEGQFEQPAALTLNQPSNINSGNLSPTITNGADFLIISNKTFIPSFSAPVAPGNVSFIAQRQAQGRIVATVDIDDVYDEFSYGLHGPQAIKNFLAYASTNWTIAPRYVIFAGDASYDPRNYMGLGDLDFVPTKLVDATYNETASDDWLADFDNDGAADIAIGRLPVGTASDASLVISKIVNFAPANVPQNALLVADDPGTPAQWDFETASDDVQALLPASMTVQRVNVRTEPSAAQATADIIDGFTQGRAVVNYSGHGNVNVWSGASIFTSANATSLTNGNQLPLVIVMDCLNGYFQDPNLLSLSEAFLLAPNGGAVAAFASSGLTSTPGQRQMELQLYALLYGAQPIAVGDAIKTAKAATSDIDVRRTWIYFGDPSLMIR